jgi:hypothetical protein
MNYFQPTKDHMAIHEMLCSVGLLESGHAKSMIINREDEINASLASGKTPEQIATSIVLLSLIGVSELEEQYIYDHNIDPKSVSFYGTVYSIQMPDGSSIKTNDDMTVFYATEGFAKQQAEVLGGVAISE